MQFWNCNFKHKMERLQITQKNLCTKNFMHKKILHTQNFWHKFIKNLLPEKRKENM